MSTSIKNKSKPKSEKVATNKTNKTTNDHFFAKNKFKSISGPNFTKSEGKVRFGTNLKKKIILSTSRKGCH